MWGGSKALLVKPSHMTLSILWTLWHLLIEWRSQRKWKHSRPLMMSSITSNIVSPTTRQPYSIVIGMMIQPQIKTQLQQLLGEVILKSVKTGETVIVTGAFENWKEVCSNYLLDAVIQLLECDHKEADTRILLHVIRFNASCFVIDCNDTMSWLPYLQIMNTWRIKMSTWDNPKMTSLTSRRSLVDCAH